MTSPGQARDEGAQEVDVRSDLGALTAEDWEGAARCSAWSWQLVTVDRNIHQSTRRRRPRTTEQEMSVDDCHCRPMCMPYMIKQTAVEEVDDGARVLGELSGPVARHTGDHRED